MKVYVVERGEYSDRDIIGAFSSREWAVAVIEFKLKFCKYQDAYEIHEMEVDEIRIGSDKDMFDVYLKNGVWHAKETDYIGYGKLGRLRKGYFSLGDMSGVFFARDEDEAIKMAQDAYAKMKAEEIGL